MANIKQEAERLRKENALLREYINSDFIKTARKIAIAKWFLSLLTISFGLVMYHEFRMLNLPWYIEVMLYCIVYIILYFGYKTLFKNEVWMDGP